MRGSIVLGISLALAGISTLAGGAEATCVQVDGKCVGTGGVCGSAAGVWYPVDEWWGGACVGYESWGCSGGSVWVSDGPNSAHTCVGHYHPTGCSGLSLALWSYGHMTDSLCPLPPLA